jgi:uncharacterized protein
VKISRRKFNTAASLASATLAHLFLSACKSGDGEDLGGEGGEPGTGGKSGTGGQGGEPGSGGAANTGGYGPLVKKTGALIALPEGFRYVAFSKAGDIMTDGNKIPVWHDGMAAFSVPGQPNRVRLVRNHEVSGVGTAVVEGDKAYDAKGTGAVTITEWDMENEEVVKDFIALSGSIENCSGGPDRGRRYWLSCEENTDGVADGYDKDHGYVFQVSADAEGLVEAIPLKAMGRFLHEATATDPQTGDVYMTEDEGPDSFYRFVPEDADNLTKGGTLWALKIDSKGGESIADNYDTGTGQTVGVTYECSWVQIDDPDPRDPEDPARAVFDQGQAKGATLFQGLEGLAEHGGAFFITASDGGDEELGQVWRYTPTSDSGGELTLIFEAKSGSEMDGPDNLCVAPNGTALVVCEDGDGEDWTDGDDSCKQGGDTFLRIVTLDGQVYDLAQVTEPLDLVKNFLEDFEEDCTADPLPGEGEVFGASEFSGATFSPDGKWLFVNIQYPGITVAITGPWEQGALG